MVGTSNIPYELYVKKKLHENSQKNLRHRPPGLDNQRGHRHRGLVDECTARAVQEGDGAGGPGFLDLVLPAVLVPENLSFEFRHIWLGKNKVQGRTIKQVINRLDSISQSLYIYIYIYTLYIYIIIYIYIYAHLKRYV